MIILTLQIILPTITMLDTIKSGHHTQKKKIVNVGEMTRKLILSPHNDFIPTEFVMLNKTPIHEKPSNPLREMAFKI